jgi:hypothetical protein
MFDIGRRYVIPNPVRHDCVIPFPVRATDTGLSILVAIAPVKWMQAQAPSTGARALSPDVPRRRILTILDRAGVDADACACYRIVRSAEAHLKNK